MSVFYEVLMEKKAATYSGVPNAIILGGGGVAGHMGAKKAVDSLMKDGYEREDAERIVGGGALGGVGRALGYGVGGGMAGFALGKTPAATLTGMGLGGAFGMYRGYKAPQERAEEMKRIGRRRDKNK